MRLMTTKAQVEATDALAIALEATEEQRQCLSKSNDQALILKGALKGLGYKLVKMSHNEYVAYRDYMKKVQAEIEAREC